MTKILGALVLLLALVIGLFGLLTGKNTDQVANSASSAVESSASSTKATSQSSSSSSSKTSKTSTSSTNKKSSKASSSSEISQSASVSSATLEFGGEVVSSEVLTEQASASSVMEGVGGETASVVGEAAVDTAGTAVAVAENSAETLPEPPAGYVYAPNQDLAASYGGYVLANGNSAGVVGSEAAAQMAAATGVPQSTWEYIIARESNGDPNAYNGSGASGLFQTMPGWGSTATVQDQINAAINAYNSQGLAAWGLQ
ncbi:hypothetical protein FRX57_05175 [Streptococcus cuniculipharyngis]|uniref:Transglycosylase SLT domain-containing protein n=1 Tax=Streptococcus cuniculipharyngis TaxID=1562651 RepID=A0A5C5SAY4_9STRE|nr:hypothetical protein FRX57_05175 [Streptococcus cuniculipharyngis]